jgi:putative restriction endonuclease
LLLLALARVQHGDARLAPFPKVESKLKTLLEEFGPSHAEQRAHLPYWHLKTDSGGTLWELQGSEALVNRSPGATPNLGELRQEGVLAGFTSAVQSALAQTPGLLERAAHTVLDAYFPESLHEDILAEVGLSLDGGPQFDSGQRKAHRRDPAFREKVLRAYEYRCCVCGFDMRMGHRPAGLEAAHIKWHTFGGPDTEANGLALCSLHHKLFDLGAFTVLPADHRIMFSQQAISGDRGLTGVLSRHGQAMLPPQAESMLPASEFLEWNVKNVFKAPWRGG